jgi:hypothetical protein
MIIQCRPTVLILVLALACLTDAFVDAKEPPPPRPQKQPLNQAKLNKTGDLELQYTAYAAVEEVRVVVKDGKPAKVSVTRMTPEARVRVIARDKFDVFDRTGRKLAPMELQQRLKTQVGVHVDKRGKVPTDRELKQLSTNEYWVMIKKPKSKPALKPPVP